MISSRFLTLATIGLVGLSFSAESYAQQPAAVQPDVRADRNFFNPFLIRPTVRPGFGVNPFSTFQTTNPFLTASTELVEAPSVSASQEAPEMAAMMAPPFRPPVRSPFRPPPRPPFIIP